MRIDTSGGAVTVGDRVQVLMVDPQEHWVDGVVSGTFKEGKDYGWIIDTDEGAQEVSADWMDTAVRRVMD